MLSEMQPIKDLNRKVSHKPSRSRCILYSFLNAIPTKQRSIYSDVVTWSGFQPLPGTSCCVLGQEIVSLSNQVYKWAPATIMLGVNVNKSQLHLVLKMTDNDIGVTIAWTKQTMLLLYSSQAEISFCFTRFRPNLSWPSPLKPCAVYCNCKISVFNTVWIL